MLEGYLKTLSSPMTRGRVSKVMNKKLVNFDNKIMTRAEHIEWSLREGWGAELDTLMDRPVLQRGIDCWILTKTEIAYHAFLKASNYAV